MFSRLHLLPKTKKATHNVSSFLSDPIRQPAETRDLPEASRIFFNAILLPSYRFSIMQWGIIVVFAKIIFGG
jgi:hypothetical protein